MLFSVENSPAGRATSRCGQRVCSAPAFNDIPPDQSEPFVKARFRPLSMLPPALAELCVVVDGCDGEALRGKFVAEDAQSSPSVVVRGDDENSSALFVRQTSGDIMRLVQSRQTLDRTDVDCIGFGKLTNVLFGNLQISGVVNRGVRGDV